MTKRKYLEVKKTGGRIGLLTAGTSDIPVAEEARIVAEEMDDGAYSGWKGVTPNLFDNNIGTTTAKDHDSLAWTSDKMDGIPARASISFQLVSLCSNNIF